MKKNLSIILLTTMIVSTCITQIVYASDSKNYSILLSCDFTEIRYDKRFGVFVGTHKDGSVAVYDNNGKKVSDDYDYIGEFDTFNTIARKDGKTYVLGHHGIISYEIEGDAIGFSDSVAFVDLGNNNDGRPLSYYQGEFGVVVGGKQVMTQPYSRYIQKNKYDSFKFINGHMLFFENGKVGTVDTSFNVQIPSEYDDLYLAKKGWLIIGVKDGKYGFVNADGTDAEKFVYDHIKPLYDDNRSYYITLKDGLYGLVNGSGNVIIDNVLELCPEKIYPDNELIVVSRSNEREDKDEYGLLYGVIDFSGREIIPAEHIDIPGISEGRISAKKSYDHGGFYDLDGNEVSEFNYRMISTYSEGKVFASRQNSDGGWSNHVLDYDGNVLFNAPDWSNGYRNGVAYVFGKKFIDKTGNVIVDLSSDNLTVSSSYWWDEAYLWGTTPKDNFVVSNGEYYGVIRLNIEQNIEPVYEYEYIDYGNVKDINVYKEGYEFLLYSGETKYMDLAGNEITKEQMWKETSDEYDTDVSEYQSLISYDDNMKYKLYDRDGKIIIDNAKDIQHIGKGVFSVYYENSTGKLVNSKGKVLISGYNYITGVGDNGYIGVSTYDFEGYINTDGDYIFSLPKGYYVQGTFSEGLASVVCDMVYSRYGKTSYINENGEFALIQDDKSGLGWYMGGEFKNGIAYIGRGLGKAGCIAGNLVRCVYDFPSEWAKSDIENAIEKNLVPEHLQKRYRKNITRESFCELIYELPFVKERASDVGKIKYADTDNEIVLRLSELGVINGVGDGLFAPKEYLTREQAATILCRVYELLDSNIVSDTDIFADEEQISDWAKESVYKMKKSGIMNGTGDNKFSPKETYTTEQSVVTILRLFNDLN